jgi:malonate transporter and related proteins
MTSEIYLITLPILLLIITGALIKSFFIRDENFWMYFNKLAYYVLLPTLIIQNVSKIDFGTLSFYKLMIAVFGATCIIAVTLFLLKPLFKIEGPAFSSIFQGATRYNSYILLGVLAGIMPVDGVVYFAMLTVFMMLATNIMSILVVTMYSQDGKVSILHMLKENLKNPLLIAIVVGLCLHFLGVTPHQAIYHYLDHLGSGAVTVSLLSVGAGLNLKAAYQHIKFTGLAVVMKLFLLPGVCLALLNILSVTGPARLAAIAYASVPCAGNAYILAKEMNADAELMATIITVTTLFGLLTIPFFIMLAS